MKLRCPKLQSVLHTSSRAHNPTDPLSDPQLNQPPPRYLQDRIALPSISDFQARNARKRDPLLDTTVPQLRAIDPVRTRSSPFFFKRAHSGPPDLDPKHSTLQMRQHEGFPHLPQLQPPVVLQYPAAALADVQQKVEAERHRRAAAAAQHLAHSSAASLGGVHLSPRQRIIYGQRGGTGCGAGP